MPTAYLIWLCHGITVGIALWLDFRVSLVQVPPRATHFFFEKSAVLGVVALHLCCSSPHYDSWVNLLQGYIRLSHCRVSPMYRWQKVCSQCLHLQLCVCVHLFDHHHCLWAHHHKSWRYLQNLWSNLLCIVWLFIYIRWSLILKKWLVWNALTIFISLLKQDSAVC